MIDRLGDCLGVNVERTQCAFVADVRSDLCGLSDSVVSRFRHDVVSFLVLKSNVKINRRRTRRPC